ncbi:MAG: Transcriptional regulator, TetR family [Pseudonocardia sp.]|jgi:AcrR family transcriptional regulator|nr:Transcriptional regulator, TetR family [Pseudonocardia sp.]
MTEQADTVARADGRRNRIRVLQAAEQAFAADGGSVSLERIARLAGLGAGTVYRHFPTKESLLEAVLTRRIDRLVTRADQWSATADAGAAFIGFLGEVIGMTADHKDLCDALQADRSWPRVVLTASGRRFDQALARLLRAAQQTGTVRGEVTLAEVTTLILGCSVMCRAHRDGGALTSRVLGTLLGGDKSVTKHVDHPMLRDTGPAIPEPACAVCGMRLRRQSTGRPARYCGPACRQRAHRRRGSAVGDRGGSEAVAG